MIIAPMTVEPPVYPVFRSLCLRVLYLKTMIYSKTKFASVVGAVSLPISIAIVLVLCLPALGQDDRSGDRRGRGDSDRDRERDMRREKWRRDFNLKDYLGKLDADNSGVLESGELQSDRTRRFLSQMGINTEKPVQIAAAVKKVETAAAKKRDAERKKFEAQVGPKLSEFGAEKSTVGVLAFGAAGQEESAVASFDQRLTGLKASDFEEKTLKEARKVLDGYDADKSGFLEGDEISRIRWRDPSPVESDLNGDGRISMLEMAKRLQTKTENARARDARKREGRSDEGELRDGDPERGAKDRDGGRARRGESTSWRTSSKSLSATVGRTPNQRSNPSTSKTSKSKNSQKVFAAYIDGVFAKYDLDKDQKLSPDELKEMRRPFKGDTDRDGFISKEEATEFIKVKGGKQQAKEKGKSSNAQSNAGRESRSGRDRLSRGSQSSRMASKGGAVRSATVEARGALSDLDADSDGQIQMSEFSSTWDKATLQSFREMDVDQDGILSAAEWAKRSK